ncbi:MAG TPA: discoidin domain-containing protein [Trebonia sp.]
MTSAGTSTASEPARARARPRRTLLAVLLLFASVLTTVAFSALAVTPARADTVPPAPSGWNTVFGDNFAGAAGSAPSAQNWFYDIGTGYGTGETEQTTSSTSNVYLDGNGHLVLKATNNGGTWTSGRIESTRDDFQAPAGGKLEMTAEIEQPNPASGLGYWPAFWALGSPMRTGGGWPQSGEIDMMEDVNAGNTASQTLHDSAGSSGHPLVACPNTASTCQTGYHTYSVIVDRTNTSAETLQFLMDGTVESTVTEASVGTAAWQAAIDHGFFIIFDLAMGGNYPDGICNCTSPTSATTSGASMSVGYVAVYEQGGNSTPAGTATATGQLTGLSGNCLTNQNSLNTEGNPVYLAGCTGSAGQQWSPYSDGTVRVQGGCLDVVSAGTTSGTDVDWYPCNGTAAQSWTHQSNGELVSSSSGLCLTDPGGNTGSRLDIETCTGAADQQWTLPTGSGGGGGGGGGTGGTCGTANAALNQPTTASSTENAGTPAADATDGNAGTRWSSAFSDPQWLDVDLGSSQSICQVALNWETAYAKAFQIQVSADNTNWTTVYSTTTGAGGVQTIPVTGTGRYVRVYGTARATQYGYSLWEFQVNTTGSGGGGGTGGSCGTANAALNQPTTASSTENGAFLAAAATDGNAGTRWSSAFSDPQWLEVDLGSAKSICQVGLNWEAAYGTAFQIQVSNDNTNWTTVYSTTAGTGGNQTLSVTGTGRYIRVYGTARATQYGYSLWEFQVHTTS